MALSTIYEPLKIDLQYMNDNGYDPLPNMQEPNAIDYFINNIISKITKHIQYVNPTYRGNKNALYDFIMLDPNRIEDFKEIQLIQVMYELSPNGTDKLDRETIKAITSAKLVNINMVQKGE